MQPVDAAICITAALLLIAILVAYRTHKADERRRQQSGRSIRERHRYRGRLKLQVSRRGLARGARSRGRR